MGKTFKENPNIHYKNKKRAEFKNVYKGRQEKQNYTKAYHNYRNNNTTSEETSSEDFRRE